MQITKINAKTATRAVDISTRVLLVQLNVSQWTARKLDKRVTADVAHQHGATRDAGRYNKVLVARGALAAIAAIVAQARADHAEMSLPWLQDGTRIIPVDLYSRYTATMSRHREAFETAVHEFMHDYDAFKDQAREDLGTLYNPADYPDAHSLRARFGWRINAFPMPSSADFRLDLDKATVAALQADLQADLNAALKTAVGDAATRLHDVARTMADKLAAYDPLLGKQGNPFRDSLVNNVRELLDVLPALNITGDATLAKLTDDARDKLAAHDAQALRDDGALRREVSEEAAKIADAMATWMV